jgi:SAM-dependent methyltransferase
VSSPLASEKKGALRTFLIGLHQQLSHARRVDILARRIASLISERFGNSGDIRCLDAGCGDMKIAETVAKINPRTIWQCIDLYALPQNLKGSERWARYQQYDGLHIPLGDKSADVVLLCDVLHHAKGNISAVLREASRVGKTVVVKDHFEYSRYSRTMLKAMDFFGNWSYGVALPEHYFTPRTFEELYRACGLTAGKIETGIDLYSHLPVIRYFLKPQWHFIALLITETERQRQSITAGFR